MISSEVKDKSNGRKSPLLAYILRRGKSRIEMAGNLDKSTLVF
jgi:hypothetical protein